MRLKRGVELLTGIALGLCFFLVMLWLLNLMFPHTTGVGMLARSGAGAGVERSLSLDGVVDDSEVIAELKNVRRSVKDRSPLSIVWNRSLDGTGLGDRHAVQSQKNGGATIAFDATNRIELDESTLVVVRRPNRFSPSRSSEASLLVIDGTLQGKLGRSGDAAMDVDIVTAGGSIRASGDGSTTTDFRLSATKTGAATLSVHHGAADVRWGETSTRVPANHAVMFGVDGAPEPPIRLPDYPRQHDPKQDAMFLYRSTPPRISFTWSTVVSAEQYRLEIARDAAFDDVLHEAIVAAPRFVHGHLAAGTYFWRVSTLTRGIESRPGPARRFRAIRDRQPPPLSVQLPDTPVSDGRLALRGRSEPGCQIVIGGISVATDDRGEFEMDLELRAGYNVLVVQAIDPAGNTAFLTREIQARAAKSGSRQ